MKLEFIDIKSKRKTVYPECIFKYDNMKTQLGIYDNYRISSTDNNILQSKITIYNVYKIEISIPNMIKHMYRISYSHKYDYIIQYCNN